jgi:hypothetical protein
MKDNHPGLWVCGTCEGQYDGDFDGRWAGVISADISNHCRCAVKPQPGSHPSDIPPTGVT